jgi:hypothetical protein
VLVSGMRPLGREKDFRVQRTIGHEETETVEGLEEENKAKAQPNVR